jgi:hypothetical protein
LVTSAKHCWGDKLAQRDALEEARTLADGNGSK